MICLRESDLAERQVVDPFSARLELALLGLPVQLVSFCPARGPPENRLP